MSILDEIQRIKANIANAYHICQNKGAVIPVNQNSENLANCIDTISSSDVTGTILITNNGLVDVKKYALAEVNVVKGLDTKYGANVEAFLGDIDKNGTLQIPKSGQYLVFNGVKTIGEAVLSYKFCVSNSDITDVYNITGVSFPDLETINPDNALEKSFYNQRGIKEVLFPKLKNLTNNNCFNEAFAYCAGIERVSIPSLSQVPEGKYGNAFFKAFYACQNLKELDLNNLTSVSGKQTFCYAFSNCSNLSNINLSNLETINGQDVFSHMFEKCALTTVCFDKLSTINGSQAMRFMFSNCQNLKELSFPSLNVNSFGDQNNQFANMLYNVNGCTVHFPFAIKKLIGEWKDVKSGFNGKNTNILFDLHSVYLNFISNRENIEIYVNGEEFPETSGYTSDGDVIYSCYSLEDKVLIIDLLNDLKESETIDINLDFTKSKNKIVLQTGVNDLNVTFYANNLKIPAIEESNGNYILNVIGKDIDIKYYIDGGDTYSDAEGEIELTGADIVINIPIKPVTLKTFVQTNITENGELGGNSFAVSSSGEVSSIYSAYKVFNGVESDYFWGSGEVNTITFYNPQPLRVSSLVIKYYDSSSSYIPASITVQGSNNNIDWNNLATFEYETGISRTLNINSQRFYKYHRLIMPKKSVYLRICEIKINANYKE